MSLQEQPSVMVNLCPEVRLLVYCLRAPMDEKNAKQIISLVQEELDWDYLLTLAERHGVRPLFYRALKHVCQEAIPTAIFQTLRSSVYAISAQNLVLTRELMKLLSLLRENKIVAVPYKGPILALLVYGDVALREFGDLDIFVAKQDVLRVKELLVEHGYCPETMLTKRQEKALIHSHWDYIFVHADSGIVVEINWQVGKQHFFDLAFDSLWQRLATLPLGGQPILTMPIEELLLILMAHGARHSWERLIWICDIARLLQSQPSVDWARLVSLAQQLGSERILYLGLLLAHELCDAVIPRPILQQLYHHNEVETLANKVYHHLARLNYNPGFWERTLFRFQAKERIRDKIPGFLFEMTAPTLREFADTCLPSPLFFAYYAVRPLRLVGEHLIAPFRRRWARS